MTNDQIAAARAMVDAAQTDAFWNPLTDQGIDQDCMEALLRVIVQHRTDKLKPTVAKFVTHLSGGKTSVFEVLSIASLLDALAAVEAELKVTDKLLSDESKQSLDRLERAEVAEARAADLTAKLESVTNRKGFPILGQRGVYVDWQLVADHGGQANTNHGQTVARLAERGGLSWCEMFAVLHNQRWQKMDANDAMIACRELEARYLAALKAGGL